jgi:hypothetical protein
VPLYLLYQFLVIVLIVISVLLAFDHSIETLAGITIIYTLVFALWKPYALKIHIAGNLLNQSIVMMFITFQILGKYDYLNDSSKIIISYVVSFLILVAIILQMIRIYVVKKSLKVKFEIKKQVITEKKLDLKLENNPYTLTNQLSH